MEVGMSNSIPETLLLKSRDAARAMSISERKLWSLTTSGEVRCVRIGRSVRYDPRDLRAWIDECKEAVRQKSIT
jgi:predicted DNA-binding transcriptional regulator AlpA